MNTRETIMDDNILPTFETLLQYSLKMFREKHLFDPNLPFWRTELLHLAGFVNF